MSYEEALAFVQAHPYGTAETTPSGLDVSMIRADLELTPDARLRSAVKLTNLFLRARKVSGPLAARVDG